MGKNIIIDSDAMTSCPKCSNEFPIHEGISRKTIEQYERNFETTLKDKATELEEEILIEAKKKAEQSYKSEIAELNETIKKSNKDLLKSEQLVDNVRKEALAKARKDFEFEKKSLEEELLEKNNSIIEFKQLELTLRKEKEKFEEEKSNFELVIARKLDQSKKEIEIHIRETEAEKHKYREEELQKQIEDAKKANQELSKKLEQRSQQLQGEVLELALENILQDSFPFDTIEEVSKGIRGADIIQHVCNSSGQKCGSIIWEAKRAQNWSDKWVQKLKDDRLAANADIAVLVSTILPKDCTDSFKQIGDIWVVSDRVIRPVAEILRVILIKAHSIVVINEGKNEKAELIYDYLCSSNFSNNILSVIDTFSNMKRDLDKEKNALTRTWKKREIQLERVAISISTMVGELQAISQDSLPHLDNIEQLSLPGEYETAE